MLCVDTCLFAWCSLNNEHLAKQVDHPSRLVHLSVRLDSCLPFRLSHVVCCSCMCVLTSCLSCHCLQPHWLTLWALWRW